ncbi:M20/M25/M40 family metallo-hydrolase [Sphingosinicella soli]|uniref:Acetylornithine deacetylase/succinyl-diaminopimelate desuccinylase-like protein n=1 Tax=Sphingosinicella soli TaxID=333708 RepID=A0A7W7B1Y0_9SPHN|nr:M20/M25/M40 family metallo-hydrolase [Sphingosinicella soli]MBB4631578.1 acetylornithine deacetylase/succinyl-diaminopimelate desuccinylase-like protein [Sphingosinicella soli]
MKPMILSAAMLCLAAPMANAAAPESPQGAAALSLYRDIVEIRSAAGHGKVPEVAARAVKDLKAAGFADADIKTVPMGETAYLLVRYPGKAGSRKRPVAFLAHMDVVDANPEDWSFDPFVLREKDGDFLGRGTIDNKMGVAHLTRAFADLKTSGFVPDRDLYLAFTGDEETGMVTTRALVDALKPMKLEYALNSDAGGGALRPDGKPMGYGMQVAEKTFATFDVTIRNEGGHSSRPRKDNAIYDLAALLKNVEALKFPIMANSVTRTTFAARAKQMQPAQPQVAEMLRRFSENPDDAEAAAALSSNAELEPEMRTTCVATMLSAGHAENALPQRASAAVNCRIFPGVDVATVQAALEQAGGNPKAEWKVRGTPTASPISEPRPDVTAAVKSALSPHYPGVAVMPYQESGGTDGMWFRIAGVPTYAISPLFMDMKKMRAHGLDENAPVASFYNGLEYWPHLIRTLAGSSK